MAATLKEAFAGDPNAGQFVTASSLLTFPGATAAIVLVWKLAQFTWAPAGSPFVALGLAALMGIFLFYIGMKDEWWVKNPAAGMEKDRNIAIGLAVINTMYLAAAAVGIPEALGAAEPATPSPGASPTASPTATP